MTRTEIYDTLILGSGIGGLSSAITLAEKGFSVLLVNKGKEITDTGTYFAQGGIIYKGKGKDKEIFREDIYKAGCYINNPEAVDIIIKDGSKYVKSFLIDKIGIPFLKDKDGDLLLTREAAHSKQRIIYAYDKTGQYIMKHMFNYAKALKNIKIIYEHTAVDIITKEHHSSDLMRFYYPNLCLGAYLLDNVSGKIKKVLAYSTILATGGLGQIFKYTSNPNVSTGDGYAMAYRAGCKVINMEYTQFHPTVLYEDEMTHFLITETIRGEGAFLKTVDGKKFMDKYHPSKSLAPRDIVSRAIHEEILKSKYNYVLLDFSSIGSKKLKPRFPGVYKKCLEKGYDITRTSIPVVPAFHYACGGVRVDINGMTDINNLFAAGEVSCTGLHGANRLASTSLLEGLVWGIRSAKYIEQNWDKLNSYKISEIPEWDDSSLTETVDPAVIKQTWEAVKNTMWNYVGLVRTKKRLRKAISDLRYLQELIVDHYTGSMLTKDMIELRNAVQTALIITYSAWSNRQSIGCHYRTS